MNRKPSDKQYSDTPIIRNRERAQDAQEALAAAFKIKNPRMAEFDADRDGFDALVDLLADLRHWARWRDEDYDEADALAELNFLGEVRDETKPQTGEKTL